MPAIQSITRGTTSLVVVTENGTFVFNYSDVPANQNTPAKAEAFINNWCAANVTNVQVVVHVFSLGPLNFQVGTFNLGDVIPANWWL